MKGELLSWRHNLRRKRPFSFDSPNDISPEVIVGEGDICGLVEWLYSISTHKRLNFVVRTWISVAPLSDAEMDGLWVKVQALNAELQEIMIKCEEVVEAQRKKSTRKKAMREKLSMSHAKEGGEAMDGGGGLVGAIRLKEKEATGEDGMVSIKPEDDGRLKQKRVRSVHGLSMDEATLLEKQAHQGERQSGMDP
jgi:hypothetical protein